MLYVLHDPHATALAVHDSSAWGGPRGSRVLAVAPRRVPLLWGGWRGRGWCGLWFGGKGHRNRAAHAVT
ncbi:MAG: hypothetical protein ACRDYA_14070 [Egibacteraceae bacterium]